MRLHKLFTLTAIVALMAAAGTAYAAGSVGNPFHSIVDVDFIKQQVTVPMDEDVMIIDARPKRAKYDKGHIPMAVSIPDMYFDKHVDMLPQNKDALLIYYCGGFKCPPEPQVRLEGRKVGLHQREGVRRRVPRLDAGGQLRRRRCGLGEKTG